MRVLVSGGGTAGHVYPALAVAALVAADERDEVAFVGAPASLEARLAEDAGVRFLPVRAKGWDRARPWTLLTAAATAVGSLFRCIGYLRRETTDVVVGFGGYVSVPLALAALVRGVPLVLHEQNSFPGVANRLLARWARAVCVTYETSLAHLPRTDRACVTGNPVRDAVLHADRERGRQAYGVSPDETLLVVFGGSRGARHLNVAVLDLYSTLAEVAGLRIVQIAGPAEAATVRDGLLARAGTQPAWWTVLEYVEGMGDLLAAADLVVCRAGATTLAELAVLGKPAVLVPYPYATDDHQTRNAAPFVQAGAARVVADADLDSAAFSDTLTTLLGDATGRATMAHAARTLGRPGAAVAVVEVVRRVAGGRTVCSLGKGAR